MWVAYPIEVAQLVVEVTALQVLGGYNILRSFLLDSPEEESMRIRNFSHCLGSPEFRECVKCRDMVYILSPDILYGFPVPG
jgi:hypothetical protein